MAHTFSCIYCIADEEFKVEFKCYPGRPAVWTLPNGDPGYPEDPAKLEVIAVTKPNSRGEKEDREYTDGFAEHLEDDDNFREVAWELYERFVESCSKDGP